MTALPASLEFEGTPISIIDRDGRPWVTNHQIDDALGTARRGTVNNLYNRNRDEFTPDMTAVISHGRTRVRIFSARGCHLLGMFARTARAKAFRRWVLDVLDKVVEPSISGPTPAAQLRSPPPKPPLSDGALAALAGEGDQDERRVA